MIPFLRFELPICFETLLPSFSSKDNRILGILKRNLIILPMKVGSISSLRISIVSLSIIFLSNLNIK